VSDLKGHASTEECLRRQASDAFRDLCRIHGFDQARQIVAEIVNGYATGRR
jgi:hypothetical protein